MKARRFCRGNAVFLGNGLCARLPIQSMKSVEELKKIIIVTGAKNSGKTTVLKILSDRLSSDGFEEISESAETYSSCRDFLKNDIFVVAEKDGERIGIVSEGDYCYDWIFVLALIFIFECTVVVCGRRTGAMCRKNGVPDGLMPILNKLLEKAKPLIVRMEKPKAQKTEQESKNSEFAEKLAQEVFSFFGK